MFNSEFLADQESAYEMSRQRRDLAWICTDRDAWYPNPYYTGEAVPHPEDDGAHDFITHHGIEAWRKMREEGLQRVNATPHMILGAVDCIDESDCPF